MFDLLYDSLVQKLLVAVLVLGICAGIPLGFLYGASWQRRVDRWCLGLRERFPWL